MIRRALSFLAVLLTFGLGISASSSQRSIIFSTPAQAQTNFPQVMPADTVYGSQFQSGPGVAIPFSVLAQRLLNTQVPGITGIPQVGWVPIATSPTTASWGALPTPATVSIKDFPFSAIGDGVHDDNAAYVAAIAHLQALGGGTLYFPPGTYFSSTAFLPASGINLQGAGPNSTFLHGNASCSPPPGADPCNTTMIVYGTLTGASFLTAVTYAINAPTQGVKTVTTTTAADAGNFAAGDIIMVSGSLHGTSFWYPDWSTTVVSTNASTGVITLAEAMPLGGSQFSLVQKILVQPHDIKVSDMTIVSTNDGSVQIGLSKNITFDHVNIIQGPDPVPIAAISAVGSRDIFVRNSTFIDSYLECLGCYNAQFTGNTFTRGNVTIDGGTFGSLVMGNHITEPGQNGQTTSGIVVNSMAQYDRFIGNNITNVTANRSGISIIGVSGEGNHVVTGNTISSVDQATTIGIGISASSNNVMVGNNLNNLNLGIAISTNSDNEMASNNVILNTTTQYNIDSTSNFILPVEPVKWTVPSAGNTTPQAQFGYLEIFNASPTSVTNFIEGSNGQVLTVYFGDANTTLIQSGSLNLSQVASYNPPSNTIMQFINQSGNWFELSRVQSGVAAYTFARGVTVGGTLTVNGQIVSGFGTPTITSGACGATTNGTIGAGSSNQSGFVNIGAAATTTCTINFSTTITAPDACVIFPGNAAAAAVGTTLAWVGAPGTTNWVINGSALANTVYRYICL